MEQARSPDEAQRNPGPLLLVAQFPDFASLHPAYTLKLPSFAPTLQIIQSCVCRFARRRMAPRDPVTLRV